MRTKRRTISVLMDLHGRVAVVTGGAGHIGAAVCEALAECGCTIVVVDSNRDGAERVTLRLAANYKVRTLALVTDLAKEDEVRLVAPKVAAQFGRMDVLVHCAALVGTSSLRGWAVPFGEQSVETWRLAMEVNLTSAFILAQSSAKLLAASGRGSIIHIGSIYGALGPDWSLYAGTKLGNPAAYAASKGGLSQLTRWLATTLAPAVRVNGIIPGGMERGQDPAFVERYTRKVPLGRMATEEDMKGAVLYLASDLSAYVTGHQIAVDGGLSSW
jgi:NAD(P)-dependent dehydrogenase (short-subunit alcohol dehydrogenase family)